MTPEARRLIAAVPDGLVIPGYASEAWTDLKDGDLRRPAACMIGCEAIYDLCRPEPRETHPAIVEWQMLAELAIDRRRLRETSIDVSLARDWVAEARRPSYADLCERRGEPERAERARARMRGVA